MNFRIIYLDDTVSLRGKKNRNIIKTLILLTLITLTLSLIPLSSNGTKRVYSIVDRKNDSLIYRLITFPCDVNHDYMVNDDDIRIIESDLHRYMYEFLYLSRYKDLIMGRSVFDSPGDGVSYEWRLIHNLPLNKKLSLVSIIKKPYGSDTIAKPLAEKLRGLYNGQKGVEIEGVLLHKMLMERAYSYDEEGNKISKVELIDKVITKERVDALRELNKYSIEKYGRIEDINILLSQSGALQKAIKQENIKQFEDLIETLYKAAGAEEGSITTKIKDMPDFKKYINQLGLFDTNTGEYAVQMWLKGGSELKEEIKKTPKTIP